MSAMSTRRRPSTERRGALLRNPRCPYGDSHRHISRKATAVSLTHPHRASGPTHPTKGQTPWKGKGQHLFRPGGGS
ncbi:hypothetical protein SAM23877_1259 [Streptomyces ambofaciens ATCC 23877]|uniref:Uncharacterized protein n=1 Tax=Streptomyces ambofaciens (strain ATCC 23877 / 3486 / DSM 40053 / JCM 4204 / NBRC 12836 / NRRL B-2516) TaxID=278992 RepID=A0A0K2AMT3_STRA7|nr:hypothetical protein SAM23877_1259 [Streptomyces ambofaciens ATCC 23877]